MTHMDENLPHILVVDDDDRLRELLRKFLSENGFVVGTARNAADARAKLEEGLQRCVKDYRTAHADKDAELFEVVPLTPDPPKKDKKEDKTASAS